MQSLRRVGMDAARLTDEEILYIENKITEEVQPSLVARKLFPVEVLPHAGFMTVRGYKRTSMGQASISLYGQSKNKDRSVKTPYDVTVPVIEKKFSISWRDLEASRANGLPLDVQDAIDAARQCAEEEDKLLISGQYTGWKALGIEGLATATGRNTQASGGAWPATSLTDLSNAIGKLEASGHTNKSMYACVLRSSWAAKLRALVSGTAKKWIEVIQGDEPLFPAGVYVSDSLFSSAGLTTDALVLELGKENFEMIVERDMSVYAKEDEDMNLQCKVYEVVTPRVKRPTSICEVTGLT
jgi:uncharacterized linocin/CFP29 family protein